MIGAKSQTPDKVDKSWVVWYLLADMEGENERAESSSTNSKGGFVTGHTNKYKRREYQEHRFSEDFVHPQMHPLQNVPAAVADDATDFCGVECAREVGVHVVVVVQAATEMNGGGRVACNHSCPDNSFQI